MSVPAHTRDDPHPDGDPFEKWAEKYGTINFNKVSFIKISSIDQVFNDLANYSHNNFFSKDTVNNEILNKINIIKIEKDIEGKNVRYGYFNNYKIIKIIKGLHKNKYEFDFKVNLDYWNMLYPKAMGYSAGVIDYFVREFEKIDAEKQETKKLGFWGSILAKAKF